ncbi:LysR family transcriptional regulator [Brachybacterium nesterenkovii]|uniref:Chromosome initiation inhibitor n=1 Tax=Brachybacterium nesterenkovii TaxID=47847 RepID=A0A1X6WWE7_9MICO|nr:LysR family transcriptional regulator [Brachybacterium nesterenkovii]SLM89832.1 Chromosome initiation inhibitor [Brachybacterium nesterenkovii]
MIDLRITTLRTFAHAGTIAATAELLGYSPSAVSTQLRELQRDLGIPLLVREGRTLRLTPAGERLVASSADLLELADRIGRDLRAESEAPHPRLRVGAFSTATTQIVIPAVTDLRHELPGLELQLVEAEPQRCLELLAADRLDIAVVVPLLSVDAAPDARFEELPLHDDTLDVLLPAGHRCADRDSVELAELTDEPWITDRPGTQYRALFVAAFTAAGSTPRIAHEVVEWDTEAALVEAGLGIGLVPRLAPVAGTYDVVRVPIAGPSLPSRRVVAAIRRGGRRLPLVARALELMQEAAPRSADEPT